MDQKEKFIEDLEYIKQIVNDSRNIVLENGLGFIIWGILVIAGLTVTYFDIILSGDQYSGVTWLVLIAGGWTYSIVAWRKRKDRKKTVTFAGRILGVTWLSVGITMTILGLFAPMVQAYHGLYISPILCAVLAIAYFITAQLQNNTLLKYTAPLWWLGSLLMFYFPGIHTIIIMAGLMLFLQVVPGIILYRKCKTGQA